LWLIDLLPNIRLNQKSDTQLLMLTPTSTPDDVILW